MLKRARRRAQRLGMRVEFHEVSAENLPFADASFDTVVATLVLCTVEDPARALLEARRVLRPSGRFRFIEHVMATGGLVACVQEALTPAWTRIGAGCHLNRRTAEAILAAGFEIVEIEQRALGVTPLIIGVARPVAEMDGG